MNIGMNSVSEKESKRNRNEIDSSPVLSLNLLCNMSWPHRYVQSIESKEFDDDCYNCCRVDLVPCEPQCINCTRTTVGKTT